MRDSGLESFEKLRQQDVYAGTKEGLQYVKNNDPINALVTFDKAVLINLTIVLNTVIK